MKYILTLLLVLLPYGVEAHNCTHENQTRTGGIVIATNPPVPHDNFRCDDCGATRCWPQCFDCDTTWRLPDTIGLWIDSANIGNLWVLPGNITDTFVFQSEPDSQVHITRGDIRYMIDSARAEWDKPLYPPCPDGILGCLVLHYVRPDSVMVVDTLWTFWEISPDKKDTSWYYVTDTTYEVSDAK